ncbi:MAG: nucleotide excision repair endonuclease [Balneolaceae bacterium]|nr:nucleotide excision repair endonuclease [Balneolaceae bacterium]
MQNSHQQRLFKHYNPLEDRLGSDFFEELPKEPGIYKMFGRNGILLYVGKAKNLRNRLFTYRRAKVGKTSRKTVRLIRMVHRIEYERCIDEKEALLLENNLIRKQRPEFNRAKKSPETYYFIHLKQEDTGLLFKLNMRRHQANCWQTFGAFKGHTMVRKALGALLRLLYIAEHDVDAPQNLPSVLLKNLTPMDYLLPVGNDSQVEYSVLEELFLGSSEMLFEVISAYFQEKGLLDRYIGKLILEDLESVKQFFDKCCRRNFEIKEHFPLDSHIVPQQKLDDYLIELAFAEDPIAPSSDEKTKSRSD